MRTRRLVVLVLVFGVAVVTPLSHVGTPAGAAVTTDAAAGADADASVGAGAVSADAAVGPDSDTGADASNGTNDGESAAVRAERVVLTAENTTNYLGFSNEEVARDDHTEGSLDVVGAVEQDAASLGGEYASLSFGYAYANASDENRSRVIRTEVDRIESRVSELTDRQNSAIEAYNEQEWSTQRFLRELATLHVHAEGIGDRLDRMEAIIGPGNKGVLTTRGGEIRAKLTLLRGDLRADVAEAVAGERAPLNVYTVTSTSGVVLATVTDDLYYRDAYLGENYADAGANRFVSDGDSSGFNSAIDRFEELYPWLVTNGVWPSMDRIKGTPVYFTNVDHPHGEIEPYVDGRTEDAFREYQIKQLEPLPVQTRTSLGDSLEIRVNFTHGTGPMEVTVADADTGEPVNASVAIDGNTVGTTGADGRLWTVASQGSIRLRVTTEDGRAIRRNYVIE